MNSQETRGLIKVSYQLLSCITNRGNSMICAACCLGFRPRKAVNYKFDSKLYLYCYKGYEIFISARVYVR